MVLGVGFLLLVSLVIDAALSALSSALWQPIQLLVWFAVVTALFAMIFRYLPDVRIEWRDVWFGAAFTSLLFVLGKFALGLYLGKSAIGSSYGAAGSLVVLLVWIYWSANILFFGAEVTQVYARQHGSRRDTQSGR
jgi:membrane protein